jgi:hypothetical protein|tara:strand:+ start:53 stop:313 length:261 start_codon:yes stop_codon:yes gene_type:complete
MTIFANNMKITRVNTRKRYWNKKKQKYVDLKKPIVEREYIGTCDPYDIENFLKNLFFHLDQEVEKGYGYNDRVHLEITADFNKENY